MTLQVLLIDNNPERAKANARALATAGCETYWCNGNNKHFIRAGDWPAGDGHWNLAVDRPNPVNITVFHDTNIATVSALSAQGASLGVEIHFTGGSDAAGKPKDQLWIRSRALVGVEDPLTSDEIAGLVEWVGLGADVGNLPPLLCRPSAFQHLASLCILCQGYLAVHAGPTSGASELSEKHIAARSVVDQALADMGWPVSDLGGFSDRLSEAHSRAVLNAQVRNPLSWQAVLGIEGDLQGKVRFEWGTGNEDGLCKTVDLIDAVSRGYGEITPQCVANAYLSLKARLER